jgi:methenyltetrahydrofolate cyclohydrolase (EC 3.5.4.9)/5,10-methylenetetrahydrofolate dehydrogenase (NADP+) (EC 1.5.1.5)
MTATIIDGRAVAEKLRQRVSERTAELTAKGTVPGLAVVLVGNDPASQVYVASKTKQASAAGIRHFDYRLPATTTTEELVRLVRELNERSDVHGILVQLPLPNQVDANVVLAAIDPAKDADGFHAINAGRLALGQEATIPCTPLGCLILIREVERELAGQRALVIGRSNIVGKPMAHLLLQNDCTVTIAHSRTRDLPKVLRRGRYRGRGYPGAQRRSREAGSSPARPSSTWASIVLTPATERRRSWEMWISQARFSARGRLPPVPGGVGPMTIACLLLNTLNAAIRASKAAGVEVLDPLART